MKYLLLGGAGFIGTHLTKNLMDEGHEVTIIDSLTTSKRPRRYDMFVQSDLRDEGSLERYIKDADIVYFLAASVGVQHIDKNPTKTLNNNIELMMRVIPMLEKHNKRVVFSSSSEVYGNGPFREDNDLSIGPPTRLRWGYACAKLMTEFMLAASSVPYTIVRFFNVVGPGQLPDYGMVLPRFVEAAKKGEDLIVHGDGSQVRSFCHVTDAVDILRQIEYSDNQIYNLGNDQPITIEELAKLVITCVGSTSKIVHVPYEEVFSDNTRDIHHRVPDLTKLKAAVNYNPLYNTMAIIEDML